MTKNSNDVAAKNKDTLESDIQIIVPSNKLDADQYFADDLDGVTESIYGSGNVAYAALQASQTNGVLNAQQNSPAQSEPTDINTDKPIDYKSNARVDDVTVGDFENAMVGSISASQLSSDAGAFTQDSLRLNIGDNAPLTEDIQGISEASLNTQNINTPSGNDGSTIQNSNGGATNTVTNGDQITTIDMGDTIEQIDNTLIDFGDTINNLTISITDITQILGDTVNNLDITNIMDLAQVTNIVNNITNTLTETVNSTVIDITNVTQTVTNIVNDVLFDTNISLDLDIDIVDTIGANLHVLVKDSITGNLSTTALSENLTDIISDLTGINIGIVTDAGVNIGFDLLNPNAGGDGGDVTINGLDTPDINLDPLEGGIGDVDVNIDIPSHLIDGDTLIDGGHETLDNLGNLDPAGVNEVIDIIGGQNIDGAIDVIVNETQIAEDFDTSVDNVTNTIPDLNVGDIISSALGLLDDAKDDLQATIDNVLDAALDVIVDLDNAAIDAVGELKQALGSLDATVDNIQNTLDTTIDGTLTDILGGGNNDNGVDNDINADADIDILDHDVLDTAIEAVIDPIEDLAGDLDIDLNAALDVFDNTNTDNDNGDTDITASSDLDIVDTDILGGEADVEIDFIEHIIGDVDVDANAAIDVLGDSADPIVNDGEGGTGEDTVFADIGDALSDIADTIVPGLNSGDNTDNDLTLDGDIDILDTDVVTTDLGSVLDPVEEIVGDIDTGIAVETDVLGNNEIHNENGDSDLTADIDGDIIGEDFVDVELDIPLDPVEHITGDIDLDVNGAIDLLNADNPENNTTENGGADDGNWTQSTVIDGGGLFDDIAGGTDGLGDALPDPVGSIAEGIGALDVEPEIDVGSVGGFFG